ncbi:MAG: signal peptidase II [Dehalococcoidia bacterium]|nr:signal peptidase II [Dehalococcoidia bacterium]
MSTTLGLRARPRVDFFRMAPFLVVSAVVVALDQATKVFIRANLEEGEWWPFLGTALRISHVENPGAAFGILQGAGTFLLVFTVIGVVALSAYLLLLPETSRWYPFGLALVLGGAVGNLIDRVSKGTVTDFIDPAYYPAFNLADSAIFLGVSTLIVASFVLPERSEASAPPEA